jgi:4-hydroxy-4-methyl-2-oxoglutarate aldolase
MSLFQMRLERSIVQEALLGILVDGSIRDFDRLNELGVPIWARSVRAWGATKGKLGELDVPVTIGRTMIQAGDVLTLDCDGAVVVPASQAHQILEAALARARREEEMRHRYLAGELSVDVYDLRPLLQKLLP